MKRGDAAGAIPVRVVVPLAGGTAEGRVLLPAHPIRPSELFPVIAGLEDTMLESATGLAERRGERVSCARGCTACCFHAIYVSEIEARHLAAVVDGLPPARRGAILSRAAGALRTLHRTGLLERSNALEEIGSPEGAAFVRDYFAERIACPFLEPEGSCGVYAARPLLCREYLVTSPPAECTNPESDAIRRLPLHGTPSSVLPRLSDGTAEGPQRLLLLAAALAWVEASVEAEALCDGASFLRHFTERLVEAADPAPGP